MTVPTMAFFKFLSKLLVIDGDQRGTIRKLSILVIIYNNVTVPQLVCLVGLPIPLDIIQLEKCHLLIKIIFIEFLFKIK
jgi:hypothetical protein